MTDGSQAEAATRDGGTTWAPGKLPSTTEGACSSSQAKAAGVTASAPGKLPSLRYLPHDYRGGQHATDGGTASALGKLSSLR